MVTKRKTLTTGQAAEALGVKVDTVRHAIKRGKLEARQLGRVWYISPGAVDAYRLAHLGKVGRTRACALVDSALATSAQARVKGVE